MLMYHMKGAITHSELKNMPIAERNWYIKRLQKQFDDEANAQKYGDGASDPNRPMDDRERETLKKAREGLLGGQSR